MQNVIRLSMINGANVIFGHRCTLQLNHMGVCHIYISIGVTSNYMKWNNFSIILKILNDFQPFFRVFFLFAEYIDWFL